MKKKEGLFWIALGSIPYIILLCFAVYSAIFGIDTCFFIKGTHCIVLYGLRGFGEACYISLSVLFLFFLLFLLFIIHGFSRKRLNAIARSRVLLVFGIAPFVLALFTLLFAAIANPSFAFSDLFSSIFMRQFSVVISEFIGIVFILLGLRNLKIAENKKKKKDV